MPSYCCSSRSRRRSRIADTSGERSGTRVDTDPLSTFSVDVDTASYANVRRFLTSGALPLPGAVRIEELVNYFRFDYPQPEGSAPFSIATELAACPWNPKHRLALVGLRGRELEERDEKAEAEAEATVKHRGAETQRLREYWVGRPSGAFGARMIARAAHESPITDAAGAFVCRVCDHACSPRSGEPDGQPLRL